MKTHRPAFRLLSALAVAAGFLGGAMPRLQADPLAEIAAFSSIKIDPAKLEKGDIISAPNRAVTLPRGQVIESVYVVSAPLEKTVEALKTWNGGKQADKVYLHVDLEGAPGPDDFKKLGSAPSNSAVKNFVATTSRGQVQLAADELAKVPAKAGGVGSQEFVDFWSEALSKRARAFSGGGLRALPAYSIGGQNVSAADEAASLLRGVSKVNTQFQPSLGAAGLSGKPGKASLYWELVNAEGTGIVSLGSAAAVTGKTPQFAEIQFYGSGSYYVFITVQQFWPYQHGGKPATLVWRGDLLSSAELGRLRGIERSAAASAMAKEITRTIGYFQKDAGR